MTNADELKRQLAVFKEGLVDLISEEELRAKLTASIESRRPLRIKYGIDPSTSDIHLGHTVPLFKLRQLQELGHTVLFLIGNFTARIGDPSHKSETRKALSAEEVEGNAKTYVEQVYKILHKDRTEVVSNADWLERLTAEAFLKLTAHTTVHRLIERDDFKKRFEEKRPISLMEFLYPLLQAYDSVHLKCDIELGGTDQKFNLLMGRELQRDYSQVPQVVMTVPILEGTDGVQKMSKSLGNAIAINLEPFDMFGKVMSIPDPLIIPFFKYTTAIAPAVLSEAKDRLAGGENPRRLKTELALAIVAFYHSETEAARASEQFDKQFRDREIPDEIPEVMVTVEDFPAFEANPADLLVKAGLASSKSEARRLIEQGGVKVNGEKLPPDITQIIPLKAPLILQVGKRNFKKIIPKS